MYEGSLTVERRGGLRRSSLTVGFLLCDHAAEAVALPHCGEGGEAEDVSSSCSRRLISRKDPASAVQPLDFRFWRKASDLTEQLDSLNGAVYILDTRPWSRRETKLF